MNKLLEYFDDIVEWQGELLDNEELGLDVYESENTFVFRGPDGKVTLSFDPSLLEVKELDVDEVDVEVNIEEASEAMQFYCEGHTHFKDKLNLKEDAGKVNWLVQFVLTHLAYRELIYVYSPLETSEFGWIHKPSGVADEVISVCRRLTRMGYYKEVPDIIYRAKEYNDVGLFYTQTKGHLARVVSSDEFTTSDLVSWIFADTKVKDLSELFKDYMEYGITKDVVSPNEIIFTSKDAPIDHEYFIFSEELSNQIRIRRSIEAGEPKFEIDECRVDDELKVYRTIQYAGYTKLHRATYFIEEWLSSRTKVNKKTDATLMLSDFYKRNKAFFDKIESEYQYVTITLLEGEQRPRSKNQHPKLTIGGNVLDNIEVYSITEGRYKVKLYSSQFLKFIADESTVLDSISSIIPKIATKIKGNHLISGTLFRRNNEAYKALKFEGDSYKVTKIYYELRATTELWDLKVIVNSINDSIINEFPQFETSYKILFDRFETLDEFISSIIDPWTKEIKEKDYTGMKDVEIFEFINRCLLDRTRSLFVESLILPETDKEALPF